MQYWIDLKDSRTKMHEHCAFDEGERSFEVNKASLKPEKFIYAISDERKHGLISYMLI